MEICTTLYIEIINYLSLQINLDIRLNLIIISCNSCLMSGCRSKRSNLSDYRGFRSFAHSFARMEDVFQFDY